MKLLVFLCVVLTLSSLAADAATLGKRKATGKVHHKVETLKSRVHAKTRFHPNDFPLAPIPLRTDLRQVHGMSQSDILEVHISTALSHGPVAMIFWSPDEKKECNSVQALAQGDAIGHAAVAFIHPENPGQYLYASWWPSSHGSGFNIRDLWSTARPQSPADDLYAEGNVMPADIVPLHTPTIRNAGVLMAEKFASLKGGQYVFASQNCAHVAAQIINAGYGVRFTSQYPVLSPFDVYKGISPLVPPSYRQSGVVLENAGPKTSTCYQRSPFVRAQ